MKTLDLLTQLSNKNIKLWIEGEKLRYSAPQNVMTPDLRQELVNHKPEIMALLRKTDNVPSINPVPREQSLPLSFSQQRLWFLEQLDPGNVAYNVTDATLLTGSLDINALQQSLTEIIKRHEALRTTFVVLDGKPVQKIGDPVPFELRSVDLCAIPDAEREVKTQELMKDEALIPFDLGLGPLLRGTLFKLGKDEHMLLFVIHHIVSDDWSFGVLFRELQVLYSAFCQGKASSLPDLSVQYADYATWQRQWLQKGVMDSQLTYWKQQLAGALSVLDLPTDHPRPTKQTFFGTTRSFVLSSAYLDRLRTLSNAEGSTLFMTLLTAFKVLLYRYTGQIDISVGSPISNRKRVELEGLIGFFINTLVLRTDLSNNPRFRELLGRVREVALGAFANQDAPFEAVVEAVHPERDTSRSPLFQVMFILQNAPAEEIELPALTLSRVRVASGIAQFDLTVEVIEGAAGLEIFFNYNTALFEADTIARMMDHFRTLLENIVANPAQRISDLKVLPDAELHQLLKGWNDTAVDYPRDLTLHELFEAQVERTPDQIAVVFEGESLTYRELDKRANQLALYLSHAGVGPETLVGVYLERSAAMVAGLLAILKAGGAYVPLDPAYPQERLRVMIEDSAVPVILTQASLAHSLLPEHEARLVYLDSDWHKVAQHRSEKTENMASPEGRAYVIYTSGSTGRPKGVQIRHSAVVNFIHSMAKEPGLTSKDILLAVTTLSFDISILELFLPLSVGARVVVASRDVASDGALLAECLAKNAATVMQATPATWRMLLETGWRADSDLKMLCGGEAMPRDLADSLLAGGGTLWNMYGPTETTIWSAVSEIKPGGNRILIGPPIDNTELYVLDKHGQPVPIGVPGELHIGGLGLARGYLGRPELTAEKFVPDPFSWRPGSCFYKTGDLVRYLHDGHIEFISRIDHQVKVRGFRIELGEIEVQLSVRSDIRHVVVIVREDVPGDKRLVAYLVPENGTRPSVNELRQDLGTRLPEYMIPSNFVVLDEMPLTPNGKVDRKALPAPDRSRSTAEREYVAPRNAAERQVAEVWAELLGVEKVGIHDNFFELGGHSLIATQVISRVRKLFSKDVSLRALFEAPKLAAFVERLTGSSASVQPPAGEQLKPIRRDGRLPLSFSQLRQWFLQKLDPDTSSYNIPVGYRLKGSLNVDALKAALDEIVRRHESLRTTFADIDGQPVQIIKPQGHFEFDMVDLHRYPESERESEAIARANEAAAHIFDLASGPLMKVVLFRMQSDDHIIQIIVHHIISDGWSFGVFMRELETLYGRFLKGLKSPLPNLPIQYADYAYWQRNCMNGEAIESQISYWKKQLDGSGAVLEIPTDHPRPAVQTFNGKSKEFVLAEDVTVPLKSQSQQHGVTPFIFLLSALKVLLFRYTGTEDISIGSYIANRNHDEIEKLIGFFVNTLVMRTDLAGNPTFLEVLDRVRDVALNAYANQDTPFEMVLDALHLKRTTSHTPLFQVMFNFQEEAPFSLNLSGLTASPVEVETTRTHFDLTLWMYDVGDTISCKLEYNTDLFDDSTIDRMVCNYENLLRTVGFRPDQSIRELSFLPEAEKKKLLLDWSQRANGVMVSGTFPYGNQCIHELFEQTAERFPDKLAVVSSNQQLTYAQLNQRANTLAHYLMKRGVGPESMVGLCLERSTDLLVGLLGILKAGGAYVPLDPGYPKERLSFMLEDTDAPVVVTQESLLSALPQNNAEVILLDRDRQAIDAESMENPVSKASPGNLAYIIYTSGSTGKPKGVMVQHSSLVNYTHVARELYGIRTDDRALQFASINFDTSAEEIYPCLSCGATLHLRTDEMMGSARLFIDTCRDWGITVLNLPTAYWHELVNCIDSEDIDFPTPIRIVIVGGEKALPERLAVWQEHVGESVRLMNTYGPTEATIVSTTCDLSSAGLALRDDRELPIGIPIPTTHIYVLDSFLQPVPVGVPGELHIAGPGLARGYLNAPETTSEKFIPNPFSPDADARMYKTGDRVRFFDDGNIEFLGRIDHQVKIRGYRLETAEIEAVLRQHPDLQETVVVAREDSPGTKRLVAYVVGRPAASLAISELRQMVKDKLPDYMMPSAFVALDTLPISPNGKLDMRALPAPDQSRSAVETTFVAPRNQVEATLAEIWCAVLRLEQVGVHDNFFELGGDSILSLQIISRASKKGVLLTPMHMIQRQTIAELAQVADVSDSSAAEQGLITGDIPLTPYQHEFFEPGVPHLSEMVFVAFTEPDSAIDIATAQEAFRRLLMHHDALRIRFEHTGSGWCQISAGVDDIDDVPIDCIDLSEPDAEKQLQAMEASVNKQAASLDLSRGPVMRMTLFRLGRGKSARLMLTVHRLIVDRTACGILLEDFLAIYQRLTNNDDVTLPDKTTSYKQWAHHIVRKAQSQSVVGEGDFWHGMLSGNLPALPVDHRPGKNTFASRLIFQSLEPEMTRALLDEVPKAYKTRTEEILLTAFVLTLQNWTGSSGRLIDLRNEGRESLEDDMDLSRTVGCFERCFPVAITLEETFSPGDQIKAVKEQLRQVPNRGLGYGLLRYLNNQTDVAGELRKLPSAEVCFEYVGKVGEKFGPGSAFVTSIPVNSPDGRSGKIMPYLLEIQTGIDGDVLNVRWSYSEHVYEHETIERLSTDYLAILGSLIEHCQAGDAGGFTPSDFPEAQVSQADLDEFLAKISS